MSKFAKIVYNVLAALGVFLLSLAQFYNMRPFGTGIFFALSFCPVSIFVTAPTYLIAQSLFSVSAPEIWGYAAVTLGTVTVRTIFSRLKKKQPLWTLPILAALFCAFTYAILKGDVSALNVILSALFAALFALIALTFLHPLLSGNARLTELEQACGGVVLGALSLALVRPIYGNFTALFAVAAFVSLTGLYVFKSGGALACAAAMGLGAALRDFTIDCVALLTLSALIASVFFGGNRLFHAAGFLLGLVITTYLFDIGGYENIVSAAVGCAAYISMPTKLLEKIKDAANGYPPSETLISAYNEQRRRSGSEIAVAADIFAQMNRVMNRAQNADTDCGRSARRMLDEVCGNCKFASDCPCRDEELMKSAVQTAVESGQTTVADLPPLILQQCRGIGGLVAALNGIVEESKDDKAQSRARESAARLIRLGLGGAEDIMRKFAAQLSDATEFDVEREKRLKDELNYGGNYCRWASVRKEKGTVFADVCLLERTYDEKAALSALKKIFKRPFGVIFKGPSPQADGCIYVHFRSGATLDVVFGVSTIGKNGESVSGDTYSFARAGTRGFMMALSDGMGSGESAQEISEAAISLVENYYKAGFESDFILAGVNRLLSLKSSEKFSAMDVTVIDLESGSGDIIKIGSPATVIKRGDKIARVGGDSLPLGALEEITPYTQSVALALDDMIVMTSDGVADAFAEGELENILMKTPTLSPQNMSETLLKEALKKSGGNPSDDMTVLVGRIYLRQ